MGVVLIMLLVAVGIAACGDAGDDGGQTTAATTRTQARAPPRESPSGGGSDLTLAKRALVRLDDLPGGWTEDGGTVTRLRCGAFHPFLGASALVRSTRLTQDHSGVQERIAVFPSAAIARRELVRLDSRTAAGCLRREVRRRVSEEAGGPAGPAELVRAERLGPGAQARRYVSTSVSSYGKVVGYIDAVHVVAGRSLAALVFVSGPSPPDEALYERVVEIVSRRLQSTLG
jgi:hypothetical protein